MSEGRLYAWLHRHPSEAAALADVPSDVLGRLWADCSHEAAWEAIRQNANLAMNLALIIERLEELANVYRDVEVEREAEASSAYWSSNR